MDILFSVRDEDLPAMRDAINGADVETWFRDNFNALAAQLLEVTRKKTVDAKLAAANLTTLQPSDVDLLVEAKEAVANGVDLKAALEAAKKP